MSTTQPLGGPTRVGRVIGPSLDKIIKNVAWRKHSHLVSACKSALDKLETLTDISPQHSLSSPIPTLSPPDADSILSSLLLALDTSSPKVILPSLECLATLFTLHLLRTTPLTITIIESICKCSTLNDEALELSVLKTLLSAVRSPNMTFRGEYLNHIVKTCYNVYLGGLNGTNQICAKAVLAQIVLIVFARVEEDTMYVKRFRKVSVSELLEFTDRNLSEGNSAQVAQSVINEVMDSNEPEGEAEGDGEAVGVMKEEEKGEKAENGTEEKGGEEEGEGEKGEGGSESALREDGFVLFKNLCKLSMKFSSQEHSDDQILLRGKILSLELLKVVMDNGGSVWWTNERQVYGFVLVS